MEKQSNSGSVSGLQLECGLEFHKSIDYDRKAMRRALNKGAAEIRKAARRLVSRRAISAAGEYPGLQTGTLRKAIGVVSRGSKGGWVKVGVRKIAGMDMFYPAPLFYGSRKNNLAARKNYMVDALEEKREPIRGYIRSELANALVPR